MAVVGSRLQAAGRLHDSLTAGVNLAGGWRFWAANVGLAQPAAGCGSLLAVSWTLSYELSFYVVMAAALGVARRAGRPGAVVAVAHGLTIGCLALMIGGVRAGVPGWICGRSSGSGSGATTC